MNPVNVTVNESASASFRCNASGDPKPVVTWFKGVTQLAPGGRIVIGGDSLTILNTIASDAGQYSCNVSNGLRSHVGIAHLLVQGEGNLMFCAFRYEKVAKKYRTFYVSGPLGKSCKVHSTFAEQTFEQFLPGCSCFRFPEV